MSLENQQKADTTINEFLSKNNSSGSALQMKPISASLLPPTGSTGKNLLLQKDNANSNLLFQASNNLGLNTPSTITFTGQKTSLFTNNRLDSSGTLNPTQRENLQNSSRSSSPGQFSKDLKNNLFDIKLKNDVNQTNIYHHMSPGDFKKDSSEFQTATNKTSEQPTINTVPMQNMNETTKLLSNLNFNSETTNQLLNEQLKQVLGTNDINKKSAGNSTTSSSSNELISFTDQTTSATSLSKQPNLSTFVTTSSTFVSTPTTFVSSKNSSVNTTVVDATNNLTPTNVSLATNKSVSANNSSSNTNIVSTNMSSTTAPNTFSLTNMPTTNMLAPTNQAPQSIHTTTSQTYFNQPTSKQLINSNQFFKASPHPFIQNNFQPTESNQTQFQNQNQSVTNHLTQSSINSQFQQVTLPNSSSQQLHQTKPLTQSFSSNPQTKSITQTLTNNPPSQSLFTQTTQSNQNQPNTQISSNNFPSQPMFTQPKTTIQASSKTQFHPISNLSNQSFPPIPNSSFQSNPNSSNPQFQPIPNSSNPSFQSIPNSLNPPFQPVTNPSFSSKPPMQASQPLFTQSTLVQNQFQPVAQISSNPTQTKFLNQNLPNNPTFQTKSPIQNQFPTVSMNQSLIRPPNQNPGVLTTQATQFQSPNQIKSPFQSTTSIQTNQNQFQPISTVQSNQIQSPNQFQSPMQNHFYPQQNQFQSSAQIPPPSINRNTQQILPPPPSISQQNQPVQVQPKKVYPKVTNYLQPNNDQTAMWNQQNVPQMNDQSTRSDLVNQNMYQDSQFSPISNYSPNSTQEYTRNVTHTGFNTIWGYSTVDLMQTRNILPMGKVEPPKISLGSEQLDASNCSSDIFRCTLNRIPESANLLNKSRLPLGLLIHPFKDLNNLPVIQCNNIVRCRSCRTYVNPFVYFVDNKRWKCNLCYRVNELPEDFQFDPVSKTYGDPSRRPEVKSSTIEYIAPSEYMLRPPQPAVYLFLLDISSIALECGYLKIVCETIASELDDLPGDSRTQVGFLCYNSSLHFYALVDGASQPQEMILTDIDDVFLPWPDNLLVNLGERKELVKDLLKQLPNRYQNSHDDTSALGAALQAAFKMMAPTGGRVSIFQCTLPTKGPGALTSREIPTQRQNAETVLLNPANDFYKRLALDFSGHQIAADLFLLNQHYCDLATISGISKFSAGCIYHYPLFKSKHLNQARQFESCFRRYLTRKIGNEAVMRVRCTRGISMHTFHGNFFVRSTDLLSLPNCNPDHGYGIQLSIDENLTDLQTVCFQTALLYTSSKGERRIRVHTLCIPITATLQEVLNFSDQQCIIGLLAKMAVDRSMNSSLTDARDAFINAAVDILAAYKLSLNQGPNTSSSSLLVNDNLKLLPLYISALLKYDAFKTNTNIRLDDRVHAMSQMKTLPLQFLIQEIYPDLYPIHQLMTATKRPQNNDNEQIVCELPRLHLSAEKLDFKGAFLMDHGANMYIYVGHNIPQDFLANTLGYPYFQAIPDECYDLPVIGTPDNELLHNFIASLNDEKPYPATIQIFRDNCPMRSIFVEKLIEDRIESALSYHEFLQYLKQQLK